jgi:hypothetical protein
MLLASVSAVAHGLNAVPLQVDHVTRRLADRFKKLQLLRAQCIPSSGFLGPEHGGSPLRTDEVTIGRRLSVSDMGADGPLAIVGSISRELAEERKNVKRLTQERDVSVRHNLELESRARAAEQARDALQNEVQVMAKLSQEFDQEMSKFDHFKETAHGAMRSMEYTIRQLQSEKRGQLIY